MRLDALPVLRAPTNAPLPRAIRISLTDRCDMACVYCRPSHRDGYEKTRLSLAARLHLLAEVQKSGVERVRFTGGEPLLSPDLLPLIRAARVLGFQDISVTTNGSRLAELAEPLREAGLHRLTLSLDSLSPETFHRLTRGGKLARVLEGLARAESVGFAELKTNTVALRGWNEDELLPIAEFALARGITPRFLEVMPIAEGAALSQDALIPESELWERLSPLLDNGAPPERAPERGPARYRPTRDGRGRVGVISGTSNTFCQGCDRLRIAADGTLRPCLAWPESVAAGEVLERGEALAESLVAAWQKKPDGEHFRGCTEPTAAALSMRAIGG